MSGPSLLLFDGRCGLCNRLVQFVLARDAKDRFVFAPLQSPLAAEILARHGRDARDLDTFCLVDDRDEPAERVLVKGRAALVVLSRLPGGWPVLALFLATLPTPVLDFAYDQVAKRRIAWFGRTEACLVPAPGQRAKFVTPGTEAPS